MLRVLVTTRRIPPRLLRLTTTVVCGAAAFAATATGEAFDDSVAFASTDGATNAIDANDNVIANNFFILFSPLVYLIKL